MRGTEKGMSYFPRLDAGAFIQHRECVTFIPVTIPDYRFPGAHPEAHLLQLP